MAQLNCSVKSDYIYGTILKNKCSESNLSEQCIYRNTSHHTRFRSTV